MTPARGKTGLIPAEIRRAHPGSPTVARAAPARSRALSARFALLVARIDFAQAYGEAIARIARQQPIDHRFADEHGGKSAPSGGSTVPESGSRNRGRRGLVRIQAVRAPVNRRTGCCQIAAFGGRLIFHRRSCSSTAHFDVMAFGCGTQPKRDSTHGVGPLVRAPFRDACAARAPPSGTRSIAVLSASLTSSSRTVGEPAFAF